MRGRTIQTFTLAAILVVCVVIVLHVAHQTSYNQSTEELSPIPLHNTNLMQDQQLINRNIPRGYSKRKPEDTDVSLRTSADKEEENVSKINRLGVLFARDARDWAPLTCDRNRTLRQVSIKTKIGNFTFYVYDKASDDESVTARALKGNIFERSEIERFLDISRDLPLIDVGGNVGLVALQAAMQGRQVVAVEPIPENALRLCRSALDFGHSHLVHVINNAVSSSEGNVTLASDISKQSTRFEVARKSGWGFDSIVRFAILLDRLLEVVPFKRAALKIDVESHEGHVIAGAHKLFKEMDIPLVWMEWAHVKEKTEFGAKTILDFMQTYSMEPYDLMSGRRLHEKTYMHWPFTVLWRKTNFPMPAERER
ncbi:uncharacterized protein [Littorina saxatilis]|uniref:Methyltransferase FkbM domain-containing protein n=1 Tax=Littorina saxatilis TaxID=31220 RepID=A0AAN9AND5_9CAEN